MSDATVRRAARAVRTAARAHVATAPRHRCVV